MEMNKYDIGKAMEMLRGGFSADEVAFAFDVDVIFIDNLESEIFTYRKDPRFTRGRGNNEIIKFESNFENNEKDIEPPSTNNLLWSYVGSV